jgi:vitamin B12 transporter
MICLIPSAVLLFILSLPVAASGIENITVSATPVNLNEAGSAITIISREDILRSGASDLVPLLRTVPGFAVSQQGSMGSVAQVRVRGSEANQLLVLIDGIEANDLSQGGEFDFSQVSTQDIERIEIVRGPQSALWGADAMAGVVHIITRPGEARPGVGLTLEAGSFGTSRAAGSWHHASSPLQLQLSVDYLDTDGTNISRTGNEDDGLEKLTLSLSGRYLVSDTLNLGFTLRQSEKTTEFDAVDFFVTGLPADADYETRSDYLYASIDLQHDINDLVDQSIRFSSTDTDNRTRTDAPGEDIARGTKNAARYQLNFTGDVHVLSLLTNYEKDRFEQRGTASFFGDPNQNQSATTRSIAAEYRFSGDLLNLSFSARHENNSEFENSDAWRVTANRQVGDFQIYASIGESVKNPTFTERYGFFTNFIGNPALEPEKSLQWEIGSRASLLGNRLDLGFTYYQAELEDEINGFAFDPASGGFTSINIAGESERSGAELDLSYHVMDRLRLQASYSYTDSTQEDFAGQDQKEVRRPRHQGSLGFSYTWPKAGLNIAASYTGQQQDDFFPPFPPYQERVELDAFTLVSISGYYAISSHVTLTARMENVTDEDYEQVFGFVSPGFAAYGGVRLTW